MSQLLNSLALALNWDETQHPRDKKGRFTFTVGDFHNYGGHNGEITDSPKDWFVTKGVNARINKVQKEIKTAGDCIEYLESKGVKADVDYKDLTEKHPDWKETEFEAMTKQVQAIASAYETCEGIFGKESLSALKEVHFYSDIDEGQGAFYVKLRGETEPKAGLLELSTNVSSREILHEFIHVVQASNAKGEQDAISWSDTLLKRTRYDGKAYFGAKQNHMAAEIVADEISYGIAQGGEKRLQFVADTANIIRERNN